jgi:hypothetical protein
VPLSGDEIKVLVDCGKDFLSKSLYAVGLDIDHGSVHERSGSTSEVLRSGIQVVKPSFCYLRRKKIV